MADIIKAAYLRNKAVEYIQRWIGTPYLWSGDDFSGFDCSGLIMEVLQGVGLESRRTDKTANGLYEKYKAFTVSQGYGGCLVFWRNEHDAIIHVELMIDDMHVVGASGGGSATTSLGQAIKQNAFVKMSPLNYRGPKYTIVDPFKVVT